MSEFAIQKVAASVGGQSALARQIGVTPQAVQSWCRHGRVPASRVLQIERLVGARFTRHELRPDLYPIEKARPHHRA